MTTTPPVGGPAAPTVVLLAAVTRNGVIGRGGDLVWRDPQDMKRFRALSLGHPVVMGRKTWDSLPPKFRPLPGRRNIVLTRQHGWQAAGAEVAGSLDEALAMTRDAARVIVVGGAQVYAQALRHADEMALTEVDADVTGDAHFPHWERADFDEVEREPMRAADGTPFDFVTYRRRR